MKIEILKSAKEMIRNKNKPAKPKPRIPKTQVGPHAKRNKNEGKESYQKIGVQTQPNMKQLPSFIFFKSYRNMDHERNYNKIEIHQLSRERGGLKNLFVP